MTYLNGGPWKLIAEYTEVETGKRADRPELQKALAACRKHKAKLAIAKLDRPSRNLAFIATLMDSNVEYIAADNPHANSLTVHILASVAEHERAAISERTKAARLWLRFVSNETLAEDLLSELFLDVWRQADRFEGRSSVSTWLMSIARFKALSARRRRTEAELDEKIETTVADPANDPEAALQEKNRGELLRQALIRLSPEHREIIDLVYYHEKSVDECAHILGIPAATVKTRMFYARKKLAELVKDA
jgi:RNA polymerase sigma-70 factor, ECF subfamily